MTLWGKKQTILSHPDTQEKVYKNLWDTIKSGNVWEDEIKDLSKSGEEFWLYLIISPEFNKNNEIPRIYSNCTRYNRQKNY